MIQAIKNAAQAAEQAWSSWTGRRRRERACGVVPPEDE
jgi:hypothetical protein